MLGWRGIYSTRRFYTIYIYMYIDINMYFRNLEVGVAAATT